MLTYTLPTDPYAALLSTGGGAYALITPEQVAREVADAAENPTVPLRIPLGEPARQLLAARHAARDDIPFQPAA